MVLGGNAEDARIQSGAVSPHDDSPDTPRAEPQARDSDRVQCPNCCRLAPVTSRSMGLVVYRCELCFTVGALPDPASASR